MRSLLPADMQLDGATPEGRANATVGPGGDSRAHSSEVEVSVSVSDDDRDAEIQQPTLLLPRVVSVPLMLPHPGEASPDQPSFTVICLG